MKTNPLFVWIIFFSSVLVFFSACVKEKKSDYLITPPPIIIVPQPSFIPSHRLSRDLDFRLGKWGWQIPPGEEWRGEDTIHFRTDSTMSWYTPLGIQKYRFNGMILHYEWKNFVDSYTEWKSYYSYYDSLKDVFYIHKGQEVKAYKKVR